MLRSMNINHIKTATKASVVLAYKLQDTTKPLLMQNFQSTVYA